MWVKRPNISLPGMISIAGMWCIIWLVRGNGDSLSRRPEICVGLLIIPTVAHFALSRISFHTCTARPTLLAYFRRCSRMYVLRFAARGQSRDVSSRSLPPELLNRIVSLALAAYLADVIDGPHALSVENHPELPCSFEVCKASALAKSDADARARRCTNARHARCPLISYVLHSRSLGIIYSCVMWPQERTGVCLSPVVPLLRVSYPVRHVTLEVVAGVLNVRYVSNGLGWYAAGSTLR